MKKLLTLFAFALMAFTANAQSTLKGDVNGDGEVSVTDIAMIVNYILGVANDNFIAANADINGDGEIDINDINDVVIVIVSVEWPSYKECPNSRHPHRIDLGLPSGTKWCCCNVDAKKPEDYGGYYAWGETKEKSVYNDVTYEYSTGVDNDGDGWYDDYHNDAGYYGVWQSLGDDIAGTQYDVAHVKGFGPGKGSWQMPSSEQIEELVDNCTYTWTSMNGVKGGLFTGSNGGTLFLPAAGDRWWDYLEYAGSGGYYWSSTQDPSDPSDSYGAFYLSFYSGYANWYHNYYRYRYYGHTVRPVWDP